MTRRPTKAEPSTVMAVLMMPTMREMACQRSRRLLARSAQAPSSSRIFCRRDSERWSMPVSQASGKVTRASAKSLVLTRGTVPTMSPLTAWISPVSGAWCCHMRTSSPAVQVAPAGAGRWMVQVTFSEGSSQPSVTNFQ